MPAFKAPDMPKVDMSAFSMPDTSTLNLPKVEMPNFSMSKMCDYDIETGLSSIPLSFSAPSFLTSFGGGYPSSTLVDDEFEPHEVRDAEREGRVV